MAHDELESNLNDVQIAPFRKPDELDSKISLLCKIHRCRESILP